MIALTGGARGLAAEGISRPASLHPPPLVAAREPRLAGTPLITVWGAEDYEAAPINYRLVQHPATGFVYVANYSGVLEFDGAAWRLIRLPRGGRARSFAIDARGRIWVGGSGELCVLEPDSRGLLQAVDATKGLTPRASAAASAGAVSATDEADDGVTPADPMGVGTVDRLVATPEGVFARLLGRIAQFGPDGTVREFPTAIRIGALWWMNGALHADNDEGGVVRLREGVLVPLVGQTRPWRLLAIEVDPEAPGTWRVLSDRGPFRWSPAEREPVIPMGEAAALFEEEHPLCAAFLRDGRIVYGMPRSGLLVFDRGGRLLQRIDSRDGLPANRASRVAVDREGGLWLAMQVGLARIQFDSPFALHGAAQGLTGSPRQLLRKGDRLYVAHGEGFAWRPDESGFFQPAPEVPSSSMRVADAGDHLLVSSHGLLEVWPEGKVRRTGSASTYGVTALSQHPGWALVSRASHILLCPPARDGGAREMLPMNLLPIGANSFVDRGDGYIWAAMRNREIYRIDFRLSPAADAPIKRYEKAQGLPESGDLSENWQLVALGRELLYGSSRGMYRYDDTTDRFLPDGRFGPPEKLAGFQRIEPDGAGGAWLEFGGPNSRLVRARAGRASEAWSQDVFSAAPLRDLLLTHLLPDPELHSVWLAGASALVSFDTTWRPAAEAPFTATVRRVENAAGALLYGGASAAPTASHLPQLEARDNALRVTFAAPTYAPDFRGHTATEYRTRLDGLDHDWTPWSRASSREFTNLPYRSFVLRVQARDLAGRISAEGTWAFEIAAPWWLTGPAIAGYGVLILLGIAGIFRLRTRALRQRNLQLEGLVAARTVELERLRRLEMDEKISARLAEEKARLEVLRYQLNPHFLFNSLNAIYTLVWSHSRPAGDLVRRLAEFCRMTLTRGGAETATLAEEFTMLRAYLDLERSRWHEHLEVEFFLAPEIEAERLPPFLLLPLVENAIKYGGHTSPDLLQIRVSARRPEANRIVIEIANSGTWVEPGSAPEVSSTNIGLENLRQRLARHFPGAHEFKTEASDGWVRARLQISLSRGRVEPSHASDRMENQPSASEARRV